MKQKLNLKKTKEFTENMQRCRCNDNEIYITAISPPLLSSPLHLKKTTTLNSFNLIWFNFLFIIWVCIDHDSYVALHSFLPFFPSTIFLLFF